VPHRALKVSIWIIFVVAAVLLGAWSYLRLSLPKTTGELELTGLAAPVEILRDRHGIPHIFASSEADAQFALGFVHAQDRLWQLEMNRRIAAGRVAEIAGPAALDTDRFLRTLGVRRVAQANVRHLDSDTRRILSAYAAGVNAFLDMNPVLPPEFWIVRATPEPWSEVDSAAWGKMMAWDLGGNWRNELLRLQLARRMPTAAIGEFLPPYPGDAPPALPDLRELYGVMEKPPAQVSHTGASDAIAGASNSWVVSGARSASGKPLLANDPHLGLSAPNIWYFAHLHAPGLDAIGATLPGLPGIVLGRNERIAWSATNTEPDVQDLYLERLDAGALSMRQETIKVKGAEDVPITVRASRHGPVISDVVQSALDAMPRGYALALAWTALAEDDTSLAAFLALGRAGTWNEFVEATRGLHVPQQNLSYADVDGNIGFIAPGRIPLRKPENGLRGRAPAPGWDARYDWAGFIPFEELPRSFNPKEGAIVTANHRVVPKDYPHHITYEWDLPYRAQRIESLLNEVKKHDAASFRRMQMDAVSLGARDILPAMLAIPTHPETVAKLAAWDGTMAADRSEPLIFEAWWRELARALYADELGPAFAGRWRPRADFMKKALEEKSAWCDDVRTPRAETCGELLSASLEKALAEVRRRYGENAVWGSAHEARLRHRPFSGVAGLGRLFDIHVPSAGGAYTINRGAMDWSDEAEPFSNRHASSLRAIYDLADPQASLFIMPGGQSGNPLSAHYQDFTLPWARGEYVPMITERKRLESLGVERLVLKPRQ
jgi:penicillin amidase